MVEPIVSREEIRLKAFEAAEARQCVHVVNPYPPGSAAHAQFERDFWAREKQLLDEMTT